MDFPLNIFFRCKRKSKQHALCPAAALQVLSLPPPPFLLQYLIVHSFSGTVGSDGPMLV